VADVPLPGPAVRFDYQSVDTARHRLYVAHMNAGTLLVYDLRGDSVVADLPGFSSVHGVIAVPELEKVYATATGDHQLVAVDAGTLRVLARTGPIGYPDGLAYAPTSGRVFVSDESSQGQELVVDARSDQAVDRIELGGEAGNTVYEPGSGHVLVAVQTRQQVVEIDASTDRIVARHDLPESDRPHGLLVDARDRLLFVGDEGNDRLLLVDLDSWKIVGRWPVGRGPDVLAYDPGLGLLYVACESGVVSVFRRRGRTLESEGALRTPHAHTVSVDPTTHRVYLPLEDIEGKPVLRIMVPRTAPPS